MRRTPDVFPESLPAARGKGWRVQAHLPGDGRAGWTDIKKRQVRDLLGHASITTTERYGNQKPEALQVAAKLLETGESFKILSSSVEHRPVEGIGAFDKDDAKLLEELKKEGGVGNGVRTRDFRSHSPALCH